MKDDPMFFQCEGCEVISPSEDWNANTQMEYHLDILRIEDAFITGDTEAVYYCPKCQERQSLGDKYPVTLNNAVLSPLLLKSEWQYTNGR